MRLTKNVLNSTILILFMFVGSNEIRSQKKATGWSGDFILKSANSIANDTIRISKTIDLIKDDVTSKYKSDLSRWIVTSKNDNYKNEIIARRFLYDLESDENEYEQFGWTKMFSEGEIVCLDAGQSFICQTKPNSTLKIEDQELVTVTGLLEFDYIMAYLN